MLRMKCSAYWAYIMISHFYLFSELHIISYDCWECRKNQNRFNRKNPIYLKKSRFFSNPASVLLTHLVGAPAGKVYIPVVKRQLHIAHRMGEVKPHVAALHRHHHLSSATVRTVSSSVGQNSTDKLLESVEDHYWLQLYYKLSFQWAYKICKYI